MIQSRKGFNESVSQGNGTKLRDQLAFTLYACAKETTRKYKALLRDTGLTYTQYIAMLVLWEKEKINVKTLGEQLYLDSGTLTPMLKKMEDAGFIARTRDYDDERNVIVTLTDAGRKLRSTVAAVEMKAKAALPVTGMEAKQLSATLEKLLYGLTKE